MPTEDGLVAFDETTNGFLNLKFESALLFAIDTAAPESRLTGINRYVNLQM